ncbi:MAG: NADPH-dependent FMN reductase [Acidimicrobiales bacterium]
MRIGIIIGSVREVRQGALVGAWVADHATAHGEAEFELLDLQAFDVPIFTSAVNPALADRQYDSPQVQRWSQAVDACDGFIFITPEYNHGVPGAFKNAVDSLGPEWTGKTVAFVSYGADNGVRAVEQWRQIIANFQMLDVRAHVGLSLFSEFGPDGLQPADRRAGEITTLLDQLIALTARDPVTR